MAGSDGISVGAEDDWDRAGGAKRHVSIGRARHYDKIDTVADKVFDQLWDTLVPVVRPAILDNEVASLNPGRRGSVATRRLSSLAKQSFAKRTR